MFLLEIPSGRPKERAYAARVVLREFLGLEAEFVEWAGADWRISARGDTDPSRRIVLPDVFFPVACRAWLQAGSLPRQGELVNEESQHGLPGAFSRRVDSGIGHAFEFDVFGAAFYMLTRYEEQVIADRDRFGRFQAKSRPSAIAVATDDPVVDRAVDALRQLIEKVWPGSTFRQWHFEVRVTHDVDALRNSGRSLSSVLAACGADILRRKDPLLAWRRASASMRRRRDSLDSRDPFNTFDFLMRQSEKRGITSHFYFVPEPRTPEFDPDYTVTQLDVLDLMRSIAVRGHRIGLHAGFDAAYEGGRVAEEFALLRQAAERVGVEQPEWGGRHHYLRWRPECSWGQWNAAGLDYDSSVGFAESPGFRCGTTRRFPVWDLGQERELRLVERPLILMESTLFNYQRMSGEAALECGLKFARLCRAYGGEFVLLWHNHNLLTRGSRELYTSMLDGACRSI